MSLDRQKHDRSGWASFPDRRHRAAGLATLALLAAVVAPSPVWPALGADDGGADAPPVHRFGYLSSSDGTRLAYSLYLPAPQGRFPLLLQYDPYLGGGMKLELGVGGGRQAAEYLQHGYAVLGVSMRGTGCSQGSFQILADVHVEDAGRVLDWAAAQPWSNGRVGVFGNSYSGMAAYLVGASGSSALRAVAAGAASGDLYTDTVYPGGIFNLGQFSEWSLVKEPWAAALGARQRLESGDDECRETRSRQPHNGVYEAMRSHPLWDDWWQGQSLLRRAAEITVPTLVAQAWQDTQVGVKGGVDLFAALGAERRRLIVGNGGHGFFNSPPVGREVLRWFDRWLKDEDNGVEREPAVTVLFEAGAGGDGEPAWVKTYSELPPRGVEPWTLYLTAGERLVASAPELEARQGERTYRYPGATELTHSDQVFALVPATSGALTWRSEPLPEDVVVVGTPVLVLQLATTATDTDLMAVLHDVRADGQVQFVQRGFLRASHRLDPERSTALRPVHRHDRIRPLEPGRVEELTLSFLPVGHAFRRGHRIELVLTSPPPPQMTGDGFGFEQQPEAALNTVRLAADQPSRLDLPRLPGERAAASLAPCAAFPDQPCRPATAEAPRSVIEQFEERRQRR